MSLRDRLESKQRRRVTWTVEVSDPSTTQARVAAARAQLAQAEALETSEESRAALAAELADAERAVATHYEQVQFEALDPDLFEAMLVEHSDAAGDVDRARMRPALAAACAVDEGLRDEQWWADRFASGVWSKGEIDDLYHLLVTVLNYSVPRGAYSKG